MASSTLVVAHLALATLSLLSFSSIGAQNLTAIKCNGALPTGREGFAMVYDNDDTIYIFGGYIDGGVSFLDDVIKYSISQDATETVGKLPYRDRNGGAVLDRSKNIIYLPGEVGSDIYKYFPNSGSFAKVSSFTEYKYDFGAINPDLDTALIFGGGLSYRKILSLDLNSMEMEQVALFPSEVTRPSVIWVEEKDAAYVFQDVGVWFPSVQKYFRSSRKVEELSIQIPITSYSNYAAVWNGRFAFLIGQIAEGNPRQSLVRFDPETETIAFLPVNGYVPVQYAAAVYIEKLNRIYICGGRTTDRHVPEYYREIYYIQLDPLQKN